MHDSITERFFRAPGPRTNLFERILCRKINNNYQTMGVISSFYYKNFVQKDTFLAINYIASRSLPIPGRKLLIKGKFPILTVLNSQKLNDIWSIFLLLSL